MPCSSRKARKLLKEGKAKVISNMPFTIKLLYGSSGYRQNIVAGMDSGSKTIGSAAIANGKILYQSEIELRGDVSKKMQQRAMYRRTRRGRKTRYRPSRWFNRASIRKNNRLAPSVKSKLDSHLREKRFIESILPVTHYKVETANFDIHKIINPEVSGINYQNGLQKDFYNVKAYVLHRDNYTCQSKLKRKHSKKLHVHHIVFQSKGGANTPDNLLTLCESCHNSLHLEEFTLSATRSKTKHATEVGIIKTQLKKRMHFQETFGYETKFKREKLLKLPKTHYYDAVAICCEDNKVVELHPKVFYKKHVAKGDYQQTKGKRSEKPIPTGKLFGLRKLDRVQTDKGIGFVKGKRSSGFFALMDILGQEITKSVNIKKNIVRLYARTTTLIQLMEAAIPLGTKVPSLLAEKR